MGLSSPHQRKTQRNKSTERGRKSRMSDERGASIQESVLIFIVVARHRLGLDRTLAHRLEPSWWRLLRRPLRADLPDAPCCRRQSPVESPISKVEPVETVSDSAVAQGLFATQQLVWVLERSLDPFRLHLEPSRVLRCQAHRLLDMTLLSILEPLPLLFSCALHPNSSLSRQRRHPAQAHELAKLACRDLPLGVFIHGAPHGREQRVREHFWPKSEARYDASFRSSDEVLEF
mmetsp:Transcript_37854/g.121783  ORF Transcript_37854/g.121783 Transcript_37854/m.121783 type:complete len:232 (-) Transcript_37854:796-1491(-)